MFASHLRFSLEFTRRVLIISRPRGTRFPWNWPGKLYFPSPKISSHYTIFTYAQWNVWCSVWKYVVYDVLYIWMYLLEEWFKKYFQGNVFEAVCLLLNIYLLFIHCVFRYNWAMFYLWVFHSICLNLFFNL